MKRTVLTARQPRPFVPSNVKRRLHSVQIAIVEAAQYIVGGKAPSHDFVASRYLRSLVHCITRAVSTV